MSAIRLFTIVLLLCITATLKAQPVITAVNPASAPKGAPVTLSGSGFGASPADNKVYFGGVQAAVTSVGAGSITVTCPAGAAYAPVRVMVNGLSGYSAGFFNPAFTATNDSVFGTSFIRTTSYGSGQGNPAPSSPVAADFNGDGKVDVISGNSNRMALFVLKNKATPGIMGFDIGLDIQSYSSTTYHVAATDLDGDGKIDLASTSYGGRLSLFRNISTTSMITFAARIDIITNLNQLEIASSDLDGDGRPDLVTVNGEANTLSIYRNTSTTGNISFATPIDLPTGNRPAALAIGDLNGDGKVDIAVVNTTSNTLSVFRNTSTTGNITMSAGTNIACAGYPVSLRTGDMNNDGRLDLVTANYANNSFSVFINTTPVGNDIIFNPAASFISPGNPQSVALGDLNGDGETDVVVASEDRTVRIFENTTQHTAGVQSYRTPVAYPIYASAMGLAINDFDNDGRPEVCIGTYTGGGALHFYYNLIGRPAVHSIFPAAAGAGETITLTGVNLEGITGITIGGVPVTSYTVVNATTITAVVANGSFGGQVKLFSTPETGPAIFEDFSYTGPHIDEFSPMAGAGGSTVTIYGYNFTGATAVSIGGVPVTSFFVNTHARITAIVGNGATGKIKVTTPKGFHESDSVYTFYNRPAITGFRPTSAGPGDSIRISGQYFTTVNSVKFGGANAASFSVNSDTSITAIVSQGASGFVATTSPGGKDSLGGFTFTKPIILCPSLADTALDAGRTGTTYQWQADAGTGFEDIADNGFYTATNAYRLQLHVIPSAFTNYIYRCIINGQPGIGWRLDFRNVFTGSANSNWESPSNWSCGVLPDSNTNVVINSGNVLINSNVTIRSLTVASGATVTVGPGFTLIITH